MEGISYDHKMANNSPLTGKSGAISSELELRFAKGQYKFGEELSAVELASEFGASLQPIRAALGHLRAQGYIIITPQVGCKVASPTFAEINDFFRLFGRMEGVMAALAAERHDDSQGKLIDDAANRILDCKVPEHGMPARYAELVGEWHSAVRALARSPALEWRLSSFWNMSDFLLWQGAPNLAPDIIRVANEQRDAIKNAIITRNCELAEALMFEHVRGKPLRVRIID